MVDLLGQAAFSRAVQALDAKTGMLVCLKIIKVRTLGGRALGGGTLRATRLQATAYTVSVSV